MKLGVDIYSVRSLDWTAFEYLDYCHGLGLDVVHFSDLGPFERTDDAYMRSVKARADDLGLDIEAGMGSICPTSASFRPEQGSAVRQASQMLHIASLLGSPVLRCVLGGSADRHGDVPIQTHIENTIATCKAVRGMAMDLSIKLAVENHAGDMQGWELRELIERAGPEYVGACIDPGNAMWVHEDPMVTLKHLAPYIATSHVRDSAVWRHPRGAAVQWVAMGDGNVGIDAWAASYREMVPDAPFTLEIITGGTPHVLSYWEDAYWEAFPNARASEFARFVRLAENGLPYAGTAVVTAAGDAVPEEYQAAKVAQQRHDLERSARYCREVLGIGE